jgi:DNA-binding PadR family transcriptional regulator
MEEGYLKRGSPRGIWELTDEGWEYLKNIKSQRKLI